MSGIVTVRDEILGAALLELEVPEHLPDFHARLHYVLAEEQRLRLSDERRRTRNRRRRIAWGVRVSAAGALAAFAIVALGLPHSNTGQRATTWVEVRGRVADSLASARTMTGEIAYHARDPLAGSTSSHWSFGLTAQGDLRLRQGHGDDLAYDAQKGVERSLNRSAAMADDSTVFAVERRGLAPGRPDPGPSDSILQRDLGAVVRAMLAAKDPRVEEISYQGRAAWRVEFAVAPNSVYGDADRFLVDVDEQTGLPVHVLAYLHGKLRSEVRVDKLAVDSKLAADEFTLRFSRGQHVERSDAGFRRVPLEDVAGTVGYAPLVPATVPSGYRLAEVAVALRSPPTGVEGANPESRRVVSLSYRRGLDQFIVTTRLRHVAGSPDRWSDPLATGEGFRDEPEKITLQGGALADLTAKILIVPRNIPHLWSLTDELVVTVSGDLTRDELVAVAQSLSESG